MIFPDHKSAVQDRSCQSENPPRFHVISSGKKRQPNSPERVPLPDSARNAQSKIDGVDCAPLPFFSYGAKVKLIEKIKLAINPENSIRIAEPKTLGPAELRDLYSGTTVPHHRYLAPSLTEAVHSPKLAPHPAKWLDVSGIDVSSVVNAWLNTNGNTEYEQLYCIGLDPDTGQLTGVLTVKQGIGYSGGPCTAGSKEYISFWIDYGSGLQYEGTTSVTVHDFGWLPPAGLEYSVSLPVNLLSRLQACGKGIETIKVRAVLSWNMPPSTADPYAPVVWGNTMECRIQVPFGQELRAGHRAPSGFIPGDAMSGRASDDGRVVEAAIKALKSMAFGSNAGITVTPNSAISNARVTDRSFTIDAMDIQGGYTFTLWVWNGSSMNPSATSGSGYASAGYTPHARS